MKVIIKNPGCNPYVEEIVDELENYQEIVGGHIECVPFLDDSLIICNEEGKLMGLDFNFYLGYDMIVGPVIICGQDGEEFADVPFDLDELQKRWPGLWNGINA